MNEIAVRRDTAPNAPSQVLGKKIGPHLVVQHEMFKPPFQDFRSPISEFISTPWPPDACIPDVPELRRMLAQIEVRTTPSRMDVGRVVAAMLDAIPTFKAAEGAGYVDALILVLMAEAGREPFTLEALSGAAFRLLRSERFAPTPDALVEAIRSEDSRYRHRADQLRQAIDKLEGPSAQSPSNERPQHERA